MVSSNLGNLRIANVVFRIDYKVTSQHKYSLDSTLGPAKLICSIRWMWIVYIPDLIKSRVNWWWIRRPHPIKCLLNIFYVLLQTIDFEMCVEISGGALAKRLRTSEHLIQFLYCGRAPQNQHKRWFVSSRVCLLSQFSYRDMPLSRNKITLIIFFIM